MGAGFTICYFTPSLDVAALEAVDFVFTALSLVVAFAGLTLGFTFAALEVGFSLATLALGAAFEALDVIVTVTAVEVDFAFAAFVLATLAVNFAFPLRARALGLVTLKTFD